MNECGKNTENAGKYGPVKLRIGFHVDTFHVVMRYQLERLERPHEKAGSVFHIHTLVILLLLFS